MSANVNLSIPDKYVGKFTPVGEWGWSGLKSPMKYYTESLWTNDDKAYALYEPKITAVGKIRISAYMLGNSEKQDTNEEYEIHYAGGVDRVYVDLSKYGKDASDWLVLGTYDFDGNATEYVRLNRITEDTEKATRASTIRFEILNSSNNWTDVWQYLYLGPSFEKYTEHEMEEFNKFKDMDGSPYKYSAEVLAYLGIIKEESDAFNPDRPVSGKEFSEWLSAASGIEADLKDGDVSYLNACKAAYDAAIKSGRNLEWMESATDAEDFVEKSEMLKNQPSFSTDKALTRGEAATFVKGYYHTFAAAGVDKSKWKLTFHDEFNGNKLREDVWVYDNSAPAHILSSRWKENAEVKDGSLRLLTKKENHPQSPQTDWTTGNVWVSPEVFSQCGGYWEASIKINAAPGLNNAFWMIGNGNEIDIVEAHYKNAVHTNYHHNGQHSENYNAPYDLSEDFHIYALDWREDELIYYFDGKEISRKTNLAAHDPLYPYFSTAVLNWAGKIGDEADGKAMEVEWVRIYEKM